MSDDEKPVGYGNPPKEHRFPKGRSPNPRGRPPKKERALMPSQLIKDVLLLTERTTVVQTSEGKKEMAVIEAIRMREVQKALAGHGPSIRRVLDQHASAIMQLYEKYGDLFSLLEYAEQEEVGKPVPPQNMNDAIKFMNGLRQKTRQMIDGS